MMSVADHAFARRARRALTIVAVRQLASFAPLRARAEIEASAAVVARVWPGRRCRIAAV
jgi:hypothetical protein